jgi:hypothetical protein
MNHFLPRMLVALSLVGATLTVSCIDSRTGYNDTRADNAVINSRVDVPRNGFTPLSEDESTWCDAATPLGWADQAERRAAEEEFARGEAPTAIGGGPSP